MLMYAVDATKDADELSAVNVQRAIIDLLCEDRTVTSGLFLLTVHPDIGDVADRIVTPRQRAETDTIFIRVVRDAEMRPGSWMVRLA